MFLARCVSAGSAEHKNFEAPEGRDKFSFHNGKFMVDMARRRILYTVAIPLH